MSQAIPLPSCARVRAAPQHEGGRARVRIARSRRPVPVFACYLQGPASVPKYRSLFFIDPNDEVRNSSGSAPVNPRTHLTAMWLRAPMRRPPPWARVGNDHQAIPPEASMTAATFRRDYLSKPIFRWARQVLPTLSDTEREAIEAGDTWWDAELFAGNPDWRKLLAMPPAKLTAEEQAFLDGPVNQFCGMLDEWRITWELRDLPQEVWDFLKRHKFFAMTIPNRYGGLGFSATAHSEVIRKLSTRSLTAAVTAMVPNSLGPGELLLHFGTKEQQDYWLPRLAA